MQWIIAIFWLRGPVPRDGRQAAIEGFGFRRNPFKSGTREWCTWNNKWVVHHERDQWSNK